MKVSSTLLFHLSLLCFKLILSCLFLIVLFIYLFCFLTTALDDLGFVTSFPVPFPYFMPFIMILPNDVFRDIAANSLLRFMVVLRNNLRAGTLPGQTHSTLSFNIYLPILLPAKLPTFRLFLKVWLLEPFKITPYCFNFLAILMFWIYPQQEES